MSDRTVDSSFATRMRDLRQQRGMSYRSLAAHTFYAKSYLHDLATGRKVPTSEVAERVDSALSAEGELTALAAQATASRRTVIAAIAAIGLDRAGAQAPGLCLPC